MSVQIFWLFNQLPVVSTLILAPQKLNWGLILIFDAEGGSIVLADNPLDFHDEIRPALPFILKYLNNG